MSIFTDRGYPKHSQIHRLEFSKMNAGTDVNYFDLMEDHLLACDNYEYETVSNKRCSPLNFCWN